MLNPLFIFVDRYFLFILGIAVAFDYLNRGRNDKERMASMVASYYPLTFGFLVITISCLFLSYGALPVLGLRFAVTIWALALNWRKLGLNFFLLGAGANIFIKIFNGGKMPVLFAGGIDDTHQLITSDTKLLFWADYIIIEDYQMSVGDLAIFLGVLVFSLYELYITAKLNWWRN